MKNTNNISSSSSSSGWTLYLEHSTDHHDDHTFIKNIQCYHVHGHNDAPEEETTQEDEEDLSMVSDASSGPPHMEEPLEDLFCYAGRKRVSQNVSGNNVKLGRRRFEAEDFSLDDTASSPPIINLLFSASKGNEVKIQGSSMESLTDYSSHGFSATHFQVMVESRSKRR